MSFLKVQFGNSVKKIHLQQDRLLWTDLCFSVQKSFHLADIREINLKYTDNDGDDITVKNDDDLHEFITLNKNTQAFKLMLTYTGKTLTESICKIDDSLAAKKPIMTEASEMTQSKNDKEIKFEDLLPFFKDLFSAPETSAKLMDFLSKKPELKKSQSSSSFKLNIDKQALSAYMIDKVSELVKGALSKSLESSSVLQEIPLETMHRPSNEKRPLSQTTIDFTSSNQLSKDTKLNESFFDRFTKSSYGELQKENRAESMTSSKSLLDSCGFRFVMKLDNGKARFVPVPVNSLEPETSLRENSIEKAQESRYIPQESIRISNQESRSQMIDKASSSKRETVN